MKVLFLDIDGVLNDENSIMNNPDNPNDDFPDRPTKEHLKCLKDIISATDAKIVLTSTWRLFKTTRRVVEKSLATVDLLIFDSTEELECRADEINKWLGQHPEVTKFVILDDEPISYSFKKELVQTTFSSGLLPKHVAKAIEILNN